MSKPVTEGPPWPGMNKNNSFKVTQYNAGRGSGVGGSAGSPSPAQEMSGAPARSEPTLDTAANGGDAHEEELAKLTGLTPKRRRSSGGTNSDAGGTIVSAAGAPTGVAAGGGPPQRPRPTREEREAAKERRRKEQAARDLANELKYTADHVVALVVPVSITMAAVVATVKSISYYSQQGENLAYTPYESDGCDADSKTAGKDGEECGSSGDDGEKLGGALLNVLIVMVILITMTFALVYCYKKKWYRLMDGFLALSTFMIAGLIFYYYLVELLWATNTVMSWPTLVFIIHQFCWGGMFAIHWKAPLRVRQFYLVAVSVLMALVFVKFLPEWTTWILLAVVACYDLVAVLCPFGPLNMLIKEVQANPDRPFLPELVYSSTVVFPVAMMADKNPSGQAPVVSPLREQMLPPNQGGATANPAPAAAAQEEEEDSGVKLGLGDFIFYSVLVGKAATNDDWGVIFASYVSIIVGLCCTIFILAIWQRPLPALPISIFLALFFFFVSRVTLSVYLEEIMKEGIYM